MKTFIHIITAATMAGLMAGCAVTGLPKNATTAQKFQADVAAVKHIVDDVKNKCGDKYVSLAPVIMSALQIALTPADVLSDIMAVVNAAPTLYSDGVALACVIQTVIDDLKALKPKPGEQAFLMLEMAQQVQLAINAGNTPASVLCASR
jgi:hypothetical protein